MKNLILFLTIVVVFERAYGQKPVVAAEYYNAKGSLYKIERKFKSLSDSTYTYLRITNDEVAFIRKGIKVRNDTTVMTESYGRYVQKRKNAEEKRVLNFELELDTRGDTTIFVYHFENDSTSTDTLISGRCKKVARTKSVKSEPITSFLVQARKKKSAFIMDSLLVQEIVVSYFVKRQLVKVEVLNSNGSTHSRQFIEATDRAVVIRKYFMRGETDGDLYELDTVSIMKDNSTLQWKLHRVDWNKSFETKYLLDGLKCSISENGTVFRQFVVYQPVNFLEMFIADRTFYHDALYHIELLHFERKKLAVNSMLREKETTYRYKMDKQGKIKKQNVFEASELVKIVRYSYRKHYG